MEVGLGRAGGERRLNFDLEIYWMGGPGSEGFEKKGN